MHWYAGRLEASKQMQSANLIIDAISELGINEARLLLAWLESLRLEDQGSSTHVMFNFQPTIFQIVIVEKLTVETETDTGTICI